VRKQHIASDVHAGHHRDRCAGIDGHDGRRRIGHCKIQVFARQRVHLDARRCVRWRRDILEIGEAFRAQQFVGDILRRVADERALAQTKRGRFRQSLLR
jgi:hypothetical protein